MHQRCVAVLISIRHRHKEKNEISNLSVPKDNVARLINSFISKIKLVNETKKSLFSSLIQNNFLSKIYNSYLVWVIYPNELDL